MLSTISGALTPRASDAKFIRDSILGSSECYSLVPISEPHFQSSKGSSSSLGTSEFRQKVALVPRLGLGTSLLKIYGGGLCCCLYFKPQCQVPFDRTGARR